MVLVHWLFISQEQKEFLPSLYHEQKPRSIVDLNIKLKMNLKRKPLWPRDLQKCLVYSVWYNRHTAISGAKKIISHSLMVVVPWSRFEQDQCLVRASFLPIGVGVFLPCVLQVVKGKELRLLAASTQSHSWGRSLASSPPKLHLPIHLSQNMNLGIAFSP